MKKVSIVVLSAILLLIAAIIVGAFFAIDILKDRIGNKNGEEKLITVEQGESFADIAEKMKDAGVIKHEFFFRHYASEKNADKDLKSGTYVMRENMGYRRAVDVLINKGKSDAVKFTFYEGFEVKIIAKELSAKFNFSEQEFIKAAQKDYGVGYLRTISEREILAEGYLFPDTYEFYKDATPEDVVRKLLGGFEKMWTDEYEKRCRELSMTVDEVVILASIIEREAGSVSEMGKVSSVFHNRLKIGMPLQSCATVQYILPERKDVLSVSDTKIESPYNTYLYEGLPEGPISNPGKAAIEAALYPEDTDYYYFKVNDDGETVFSKTLSEHNSK